MKTIEKQKELLQKLADTAGLTIHIYKDETDKRRKESFIVSNGNNIISSEMDYQQTNAFLNGWIEHSKKRQKGYTKATAPSEGVLTQWITNGKTYDILKWDSDIRCFIILDDDRDEILCSSEKCSFLNGLDWILS